MNLQQVKATATEIGDDEEDITSSSLSKYEKAVAALGVSMKQIKNGVISLRNPMEILRDLAAAVSKESKDSIKVANLLSSVGGKYRANQLSALLSNWDIYEKMLSEYNSVEAVGSAMDEAQKSANNWTGSLNQLKNSWTELVNNFVNSDEAVAVIQKLNDALQDLSSSETIKGLGVVTNKIVELVTKLDDYRNKVKGIPVLGEAYDFMSGLTNGTTFLKMANRISDWYNKDAKEAEEAAHKQEELNKAWSESTEILAKESNELNVLISEYIKLYAGTDDVTSIKEQLLSIQNRLIDQYGDEANGIDLVTNSIEENIKALIELRDEKNKQYLKDNNESIELAKGKFGVENLSEQAKYSQILGVVKTFRGYSDADEAKREAKLYTQEAANYLKNNYADIFDESISELLYGFEVKSGITPEKQVEAINAIAEAYKFAFKKYSNLKNQVLDIKEISQDIDDSVSNLNDMFDVLNKANDISQGSAGLEALINNEEDLNRIIELQQKSVDFSKTLADSSTNVAERVQAGFDLRTVESELKDFAAKYPEVADLIQKSLDSISVSFGDTTTNMELATQEWTETLDEAQKGILANVDKIKSAMEKLYAGEGIDQKSAWEIINLDPDKILSSIQVDESGKYRFNLQEIVKLKDELIAKEIEGRKQSVATAKTNRDKLAKDITTQKLLLKGLDSSSDEYKNLETQIEQNESTMNAYNYTIRNETLLIEYLNKATGNLANTEAMLKASIEKLKKEVSELKKEAEGRLNAQLHVIDQEIDKHEKEVNLLEKEKDALNDQLEALEKQKEELDKIVGNYDTVASFVQSTIEKQIEEIEDNRSKVEDYYDSLISKLKEENDERQAAIDKEEKLNALNNAKNNKVRYYDGARGWTYGVDQEALKKAQKDLDAFEADEKINALEKEKDLKLKPYDDQIKQLEEYAESWGKATDFIIEESNELLAEQILGANWREKIENKDENILKSFQTQYRNYNTQLDTLTNKEIESLKKSISAKDNEIEAKQEQVTWWKNYKDSIQAATKGVEDYVQYLNTVDLSNPEKNLTNFTTIYNRFVTDISSKEADIVRITNELNNLGSAYSGLDGNSMAAGLGSSLGGMSGIATQLKYVANNLSAAFSTVGNREKTLDEIKNIVDQIENNQEKVYPELHVSQKGEKIKPVTAYASGGINTNTGMAWLDGTVTRPELILNNTDVSKLYNWIHTMSASQFKPNSSTTKTSNAMFNVQNLNVNGVQNPAEFTRELEKFMNRYWTGKLTESRLY